MAVVWIAISSVGCLIKGRESTAPPPPPPVEKISAKAAFRSVHVAGKWLAILRDFSTTCEQYEPQALADELKATAVELGPLAKGLSEYADSARAGKHDRSKGWDWSSVSPTLKEQVASLQEATEATAKTLDFIDTCGWKVSGAEWQTAFRSEVIADVKAAVEKYNQEKEASDVQQAFAKQMRQLKEEKAANCAGSSVEVYLVWKDPRDGNVNYEFCDGVEVERDPQGKYSVQTGDLGRHPAWAKFIAADSKRLERARKWVELDDTAHNRRDLEAVTKSYDRKMMQFTARYYPKARYIQKAKSSKLDVISYGK